MGLFGLLFTAFSLGSSVVDKINTDAECIEAKKRNASETFMDRKGNLRLTSTGQRISYGFKNGDYCMYDCATQNTIRNISLEKRNEKINQYKLDALANGKTVYCCDLNYHDRRGISSKEPIGRRYKDLETGDIYVIRRYRGNCARYYYNIETKKFVRPTDLQENLWTFYSKPVDMDVINSEKEICPYHNNLWNKQIEEV